MSISAAVQAWNMMGGIDWAALPVVFDILGIADVELLIAQLIAIRDNQGISDGQPEA